MSDMDQVGISEGVSAKLDKITKVSNTIETLQERMMELRQRQTLPANKEYFESLMRQEKMRPHEIDLRTDADNSTKPSPMEVSRVSRTSKVEAADLRVNETEPVNKLSPMEEVAKLHKSSVDPYSKRPVEDLLSQTEQALDKIHTVKDTLNRPDINVKTSVQHLLRARLTDVDESIKVASDRLGIERGPGGAIEESKNPIDKFLGMLTRSEEELTKVTGYIENMQKNGDKLNPAHVLAVQIKVHHISTELEFFTSLLNKSLEGTKTIMQVQV